MLRFPMRLRPALIAAVLALGVLISGLGERAVSLFSDDPVSKSDRGRVHHGDGFLPIFVAQAVQHLVDGSGMEGDAHDNNNAAVTMWHTEENPDATEPAPGLPKSPAWVRFDFDAAHSIGKISIWNLNQEGLTDRGLKNVSLLGSIDGEHWLPLAQSGDQQITIPRASGQDGQTSSCSIDVRRTPIKSVLIAAAQTDGNYGSSVYGLSAVRFYEVTNIALKDIPPPTGMDCEVRSYYLRHPNGQPGRAIAVTFVGGKLYRDATLDYADPSGNAQSLSIPGNLAGTQSVDWLLPPNVGVDKAGAGDLTLHYGDVTLHTAFDVPRLRQWTVYLYPQSHVDIGFTTTQAFVQRIHERNVDVGIDMGKNSANYPAGARSVWNTEAEWVVENYLRDATPEKRFAFINAVKAGWICVDANYGNSYTGIFSDEEFLHFFHNGMEMRRLTGKPVDTMVQFDVPGMSWGVVNAAAQSGVRGIFNFANDFARLGTSRQTWEGKPFWWVSPDGQHRVLFFQGPNYATSVYLKGDKIPFKPYRTPQDQYPESELGQVPRPAVQDFRKDMDRVTTSDPTALFLAPFIFRETHRLEKENWPYDIYIMAWGLWDNSFADGDLPQAVKAWNEKYAYPKVIISGAHDILNAFETKFGDIIPEVRGDYTEYWTDTLGTDALRTGLGRISKERLVDAQTLWTMLHPSPTPIPGINDAWRYVMLGSEHTWGYYNPSSPFAKKVEAVKASDFENADKTSRALLADAIAPISQSGASSFAVINTLSFPRSGVVTIPAAENSAGNNRVVDDAGHDVPSQRLTSGELAFLASDIPALSSRLYRVVSGSYSGAGCVASGNALDNGIVKLSLNPQTGDIQSLVFNQHEFVNAQSPYALNSYRYLHGDDTPDKATTTSEVTIKVKETGPLIASLLVESKAEGCKQLTREIRLTAGDPRVVCADTLDKLPIAAKEGVHFAFAFNIPDGVPHMDIPWAVMVPETDQIPGGNRNWLTFQRWVDISNDHDGVCWTCSEMPLIEFGDITANILGLANYTKLWLPHLLEPRSTLLSWALNNHWFTNAQISQSGIIPFHYTILPHGAYDSTVANRFGLSESRPLTLVPTGRNPIQQPAVALDNSHVFISALKPSDDGRAIILRLRSVSDQPEIVHLTFPAGTPKSIFECLADEIAGSPAPAELTILPYGFQSLRLEYK